MRRTRTQEILVRNRFVIDLRRMRTHPSDILLVFGVTLAIRLVPLYLGVKQFADRCSPTIGIHEKLPGYYSGFTPALQHARVVMVMVKIAVLYYDDTSEIDVFFVSK